MDDPLGDKPYNENSETPEVEECTTSGREHQTPWERVSQAVRFATSRVEPGDPVRPLWCRALVYFTTIAGRISYSWRICLTHRSVNLGVFVFHRCQKCQVSSKNGQRIQRWAPLRACCTVEVASLFKIGEKVLRPCCTDQLHGIAQMCHHNAGWQGHTWGVCNSNTESLSCPQ